MIKRYLLWSIERKHPMFWGFWVPLAVLLVIAIIIAYLLETN